MTPKRSKFCGKRNGRGSNNYVEDSEKRVYNPEWTFYKSFHDKLKTGSKENNITRSHFFERVVMNFFMLENAIFKVENKNNYSQTQKVKRLRKLTLHPSVIDLINEYSDKSNTSPS